MKHLIKFGQFLRLLDAQGELSLTNIMVMVMIYKFATAPASPVDLGMLVSTLTAYAFKRKKEL